MIPLFANLLPVIGLLSPPSTLYKMFTGKLFASLDKEQKEEAEVVRRRTNTDLSGLSHKIALNRLDLLLPRH
jgi:hypothetical protein